MRKIHTILIQVLALPLLALGCGGGGASPVSEGPPDPATVPLEVGGLDTVLRTVAEHEGQGLLLNFWAIWCGPCVAELPELLEVAEAYHAEGGRVQGVSYDLMAPLPDVDETNVETRVRDFLVKREFALPTVIYDDVDYQAVDDHFDLAGGIPVTLAINAAGEIVDREDKAAGRERFEEMMRKALGLEPAGD